MPPGPEGVLRPGHGRPDAVDRSELGVGGRLLRLDAAARRGEALHRENSHQPPSLRGQESSGPDKGTLSDVCKGICQAKPETSNIKLMKFCQVSPLDVHTNLRKYNASYVILEDSICLAHRERCSTPDIMDLTNGHVSNLHFRLWFWSSIFLF